MTLFVGLVLLASSCLARSSSGCAATFSDLLSLCDTGQYLDTRTCTCRNCTYLCPANQIVRRLCSPVADSVCGPFFEYRQQKTKKKKEETGGTGLEIGEQGQVYSDSGARNSGELPLYVVDVSVITVKPFVNQPKGKLNDIFRILKFQFGVTCPVNGKVRRRLYLRISSHCGATATAEALYKVTKFYFLASSTVAGSADHRRLGITSI